VTEIEGFALGVDLGTSHTVAMLRHPDGRTRPLLFDGQPLLPSAAYLDATGRLHVGADARRLGHADPGRFEPHPKRHVDDGTVLLGDTAVPVAALMAALLGAVAREAVATAGFLPPATVTHPASWGPTRRAVLADALSRAGWPAATTTVPEPVAAARYFADVLRRPVPAGSALAVFDFGGGTLDVAVVRNDGSRWTVAASGGADDLGGLDLDAALVDHLAKSLGAAEPEAWRALTEPVTLAQWRARRQFWEDVRGAKEMLSRSSFAPVPVPGVEQAVHLTRDELEGAAGPLVRRGVAEAAAVIAAAGLAPADLAGLFLVGGSSRVPMVARLLHSELGIAPTVLEQPELPVAEGAVLAGAAAAAPVRFTAGLSAAATPTPTPATVPEHPPPITDTRAEGLAPAATDSPAPDPPAPDPPAPWAAGAVVGPGVPALGGQRGPEAGAALARGSGAASSSAAPARSGAPVPHDPAEREHVDPGRRQGPARPTPVGRAAEDDRLYADPVDPWATGEAAALAAGGHPAIPGSPVVFGEASPPPVPGGFSSPPGPGAFSSPPGPGDGRLVSAPPGGGGHEPWPVPSSPAPGVAGQEPRSRKRLVKPYRMGIAVAATLVLVAVATLVWILWPGYRALDYHSLSDPQRVTPAIPVGSDWSDAEVRGARVYLASSEPDTGRVGVVAIDAGATSPAWTHVETGQPARWSRMVALPVGVALFTDADSTTGKREMIVLGEERGTLLWHRTLDRDDRVFFAADVAVVADSTGHQLIGLRITDGAQRWTQADPAAGPGSTTTAVLEVTTPADLSGPASVEGIPFAPDLDDDPRLVQIGADRSARVLDAETGKVLTSRQSVADTDDEIVAHNGRLIVRESEGAHRLVSYDLDKLGEPRVLYTAQGQDGRISSVIPCGDDRVCFVEAAGYDNKTATVTAVDAAKGGKIWQFPLAGADSLVPVGEAVLATTSSGETTLIDAAGKKVWTHTGRAARLDAGNLLEFSKQLYETPGDPSLAGQHLGDDAVQLGPLTDIRGLTCSWNTSVLACAGDKDFVLQRFAG
jgi:outer membrane protein assembly factor BamB/actin-like ATPase involved in cell morphogenesis